MGLLITLASFALLILSVLEADRERRCIAKLALSGESGPESSGRSAPRGLLRRICAVLSTREPSEKLKTQLQQAGLRQDSQVAAYLGARASFMILGPIAAFVLTGPLGASIEDRTLAAAGAVVVSYTLAQCWLSQKVEKRKERLRLQLPGGVDLLLLVSKAGLDLHRCFEFVQEDLAGSAPELSEEFSRLASDLRAGLSREMALRQLADRTGLNELQSLAVNLMHSLRFGTPIDRFFEEMSASLRTQRRLNAEEMIEKKAPKLVFPMVIFLLPAVLIVVVAPAVFSIFKMLEGF